MPTVTWNSRNGEWSGEKALPDLDEARRFAVWLTTPEAVRALRYRPVDIRVQERPESPGRVLQSAVNRASEAEAPGGPPAPAPAGILPPALREALRDLLPILSAWVDGSRPVDPALACRYADLLNDLARQASEDAASPPIPPTPPDARWQTGIKG